MITRENVISEYPKLDQKILPEGLKAKDFEFISENIDLIDDDPDIKRYIETFIEKLNLFGNKPKKQAKGDKKTKPKADKKIVKKEKVKPVYTGQYIEKIEPEITFIKRYANLHGQTVTKDRVLSLLKSLQKAIAERTIRQSSRYAKEIESIQVSLVKVINAMGSSIRIEIDEKSHDHYKSIVESQKIKPCVQYVKRFLSIQGKTEVKEKAKKLLSDIEGAKMNPSDAIKNKISEIKTSLSDYINGKTVIPMVSISVLNGLMGLPGCGCETKDIKDNQIINSMELAGLRFDTLKLSGRFQGLIGNPELPFCMMIYGGPGSLKSTLAIQMAYYFAQNHNKKILYVGYEEKVGYTMQEKFDRLKAFHQNISTVGLLPKDLNGFDIVIIDSVNSHKLNPEELQQLRSRYPAISFITIFQQTKEGNFRGSAEYEHDVDTVIHCENGFAIPGKNRFGGKESIKII